MIDLHAHLHVKDFDADRAEVIARAREAGVETMVNVGFDVEGNFKAIALANEYDFIYATMGVHPHLASEWNEHVARKIFDTAKREAKVIALGEMGLDYYKNYQPKELQLQVLKEQLALAHELNLPVIIHCRDAFSDLFPLLEESHVKRVILHCFTGTMDEAKYAWSKGYSLSFTGIITFPSAIELREVVKKCPLDKLFTETDCPYLAPVPYRGTRNEPAYLSSTVSTIAELKSVPPLDLQAFIKVNFDLLISH